MNKKFQLLFDAVETDRAQLLNKVSRLTPEQFMKVPGPEKWSVSQILTHIMVSERLSVGYMKKKSLGIDQLDNAGIVEDLKMLILKISQRMPVRYRAPKVVLENTPEALTLEQLNQQWNEVRQNLKGLFESIEDKNVKKKIYKHPVAGRLDAAQAVSFFNEHIHHHWPQVKRLL